MEPAAVGRRFGERLGELKDKYHGQSGIIGKEVDFVPREDLFSLWTKANLKEVLTAYKVRCDHEVIRESFLQVFSLLVYIECINDFEVFLKNGLGDARFPLTTKPERWARAPAHYEKLWEKVSVSQWIFFPFVFDKNELLCDRILDQHIVLPIVGQDILRNGVDATVYRIQVERLCSLLPKSTLVRKVYRGDPGRKLFERERDAFNSLRDERSHNIVAYYGSFTQIQSDGMEMHNLIMEYVEGGDLERFYNDTDPPTTREDINTFWRSFKGVFEGLYHLRSYKEDPKNKETDNQVVHQDIKPENLLLEKQSGSRYKFILKLVDFGLSNMTNIDPDNANTPVVDSHGGPTFGAPECSHYARYQLYGVNRITAAADIWSIGCVLSDAAVWVALGNAGRQEYHQLRAAELDTISSFRGSGHSGCFHDGVIRLEAVNAMHKRVRQTVRNFDEVTPQLLTMIENGALTRSDRYKPKQLEGMFSRVLDGHSRHLSQSSTESNGRSFLDESPSDGLSPTSPQWLPILPKSPPHQSNNNMPALATNSRVHTGFPLSYDMVRDYFEDRKTRRKPDPKVEHMIGDLKQNLGQRDHIFFIDTSPTMMDHRKDAEEAFKLFTYVAKLVDSNGVEACFSGNPHKMFRHNHTTSLVEHLEKQQWVHRAFEDRLTTFIKTNVIRRLPSKMERFFPRSLEKKRLSIFVFTDGRWGKDSEKAAGVENSIITLMDKIIGKGLDRTQVMIQFIRFGHDADGMRNLDYLDKFGKDYYQKQGKSYDYDIIDTKHVHSNVDAMFYGSIDKSSDMRDESPGPPSSSGYTTPPKTRRLDEGPRNQT